jgi:hypothetical protein
VCSKGLEGKVFLRTSTSKGPFVNFTSEILDLRVEIKISGEDELEFKANSSMDYVRIIPYPVQMS